MVAGCRGRPDTDASPGPGVPKKLSPTSHLERTGNSRFGPVSYLVTAMNCENTREQLELFVLGGLTPEQEAAVEVHLAGCPGCREAEAEYRLLGLEIEFGVDRSGPTPEFRQSLRAAVASEIQSERRRQGIRRVTVVGGSLAATLLLGLAAWGAFRLTGGSERPAGNTTASTPAVQFELREKWRYSGLRSWPASVADSMVVRGSSMYLVGNGEDLGQIVAVDTTNGRRRWQSTSQSLGYLAADESRVFCLAAANNGTLELLALDAADGKMLWTHSYAGPQHASSPCRPVPLSGNRVCWTVGKEIHMLDAGTGETLWTRLFANDGLPSGVVVRGQDIYVATARRLVCLKAGSGETSWSGNYQDADVVTARPLLAMESGRAYFTHMGLGRGSQLFCIDEGSRELIWKKDIPRISSLLVTPEGVYLRGRRIMAMNGQTGDMLWACAAEGCGPLSVVDGVIYFVDTRQRGRLVALEQHSGRVARDISGIRSCGAFTKVGNTGYIKTQDGVVHALAMSDPPQP